MATTIRLTGDEQVRQALSDMSDGIRAEVSKAVVGTAVELRRDVVKSIQHGPASGRLYQKYNPRRTHRASAPGQPPMSDTGRLASSIVFDQEGDLTASVGSSLVYALYLEYGTRKMRARPFFRPAVEEMRAKFNKRLEKAIAKATR